MRAAVGMNEHSGHRSPRPFLSVLLPARALGHQSRRLQRALDPLIAQFDPMLFPELLVKMTHVPPGVFLAIQPQHLLRCFHRHSLAARPALSPVKQPVVPIPLVPPTPPPQRPWTPPQYLRRIQPTDLSTHRPRNYFLHFHDL